MELLLTENRTTRAELSEPQVQALLRYIPELTVSPAWGHPGNYDLTPSQFVGHVSLSDLSVEIRPKVQLRSVMFMLAYALDSKHWRDLYTTFIAEPEPLEGIAVAFGRELTRILLQGLLRGYSTRSESLAVLRGRVFVPEQLRRWYGRMPPIECAYDEFSEDILENRLIKAALGALRSVRVRNARARAELAHSEMQLDNVEEVQFDSRDIPEVTYSRLNDRFKRTIELARLILKSSSFEAGRRGVSASAFLVDLAGVFEAFVLIALRESIGLAPWSVPPKKEHAFLDVGGRLRLIPDIAFRHAGQVVAVGDVKYKRTPPLGVQHPDVYQVLSYVVAFNLPDGVLVYPKGEQEDQPSSHIVRNAGKSLHVFTLDLNAAPAELLASIDSIACSIRRLGAAAVA